MAFDTRRRRVVLFGGSNKAGQRFGDTWEYKWIASYTSFGTGCAGSVGTPKLAAATGSLPWVGQPFTVELTNLPRAVFNVPFLIVGGSNTAWGTTRLPFDLKPLGAAGCPLLVSPDFIVLLSNSNGKASFTATVPNNNALLGLTVHEQGYVLDGGANALGVAVSNGASAKLGAK